MNRSAAAIGPGRARDLAGLHGREQVRAGDEVDAVEDARLHELAGAARRQLLGVLEDEAHLAGELVAPLREQLGRPEQHRGVAVVPAGVHDAGPRRGELERRSPRGSAARPCPRAARRTLPGRAPRSRATTPSPVGRSISRPPNERSVSSTNAGRSRAPRTTAPGSRAGAAARRSRALEVVWDEVTRHRGGHSAP